VTIDTSWPVTIVCEGPVAGASVVWRDRDELQVTVVAKVTLLFGTSGLMRVAGPVAVIDSELATSLMRCHVLLTGSCDRLIINRGADELLATETAGETDYLQGGETVILERGQAPHISVQLPRLHPHIRFVDGDQSKSMLCHLDTLVIDAELRRCQVLYRGHTAVADEASLGTARCEITLDLPDPAMLEGPLDQLDSTLALRKGPPPRPALDVTAPLNPQASSTSATPFRRDMQWAPPHVEVRDPLLSGATLRLTDDDDDESREPALPFSEASKPSSDLSARIVDAVASVVEPGPAAATEAAEAVDCAESEAALRRQAEATRFAAEQEEARRREEEQRASDKTEKRKTAKQLRSRFYSGFAKKP
jgi:hypothetical protein